MKFSLKSDKRDPVKTYVSEDGFWTIVKRPSSPVWVLKRHSLFNILGEVVGEYGSLEEAMDF